MALADEFKRYNDYLIEVKDIYEKEAKEISAMEEKVSKEVDMMQAFLLDRTRFDA